MPRNTDSVLDRILAAKRQELASRKDRFSGPETVRAKGVTPPSFEKALRRDGINIIAEIKYRSPSGARAVCEAEPERIARQYAGAGAAAISVLTDRRFFGGELDSIAKIHQSGVKIPLLRKDFILDRSQLIEARAAGASSCLLIVAALDPVLLVELICFSRELEMESLVEVHDERELRTARLAGARIIGVNNRDLRTLDVDVRTAFRIARHGADDGVILVSESGLTDGSLLRELRDAGFSAFLVGTWLMQGERPGDRLKSLLQEAGE
jgi:indole-3-glycerol phosphate synthase